jgi:AraC family ethanolamine operon transcriptional activator
MDGTTAIDRASHHAAAAAGISIEHDEPAPSRFAAPTITRIHSQDADEFCETLLDWSLDVTQLRPGTFDGRAFCIPLGPALVCCVAFNQPMAVRWSAPDRCLSMARPGRGSDATSVDGHQMENGMVCMAGPNTEGETVARGRLFETALSIQLDYLQSQAEWLGNSVLRSIDRLRIHTAGTAWTSGYLDAVEWIIAVASQGGSALSRPEVCASLADVLLARVKPLHAAQAPLSENREMRASRRVAVERAREYIQANLTDPIRLSDLCRYARTQARSLEYGFREVLGVSPIAYIRATRLHRVRRLLRSTTVRSRSISEIALDCGFWHLSQFAVDYKSVFNERPSVTYRRTQAQLPRGQRRRTTTLAFVAPRKAGAIRQVRMRSIVPTAMC